MIFAKLTLSFLLFVVKFNPIVSIVGECTKLNDINLKLYHNTIHNIFDPHPRYPSSPECVDSPLKLLVDDDVDPRRRCGWAANHGYCDQTDVASHCPVSCGTCDTYMCEDSTAEVLWYDATVHTCSSLTVLELSDIDYYCNSYESIEFTCRSTCGYCEEAETFVLDFEDAVHFDPGPVPHLLDPESGLTFDGMYGMDATQGWLGSGYEYGTISGEMTLFNGWAAPGTISCVGGSFTLKEVYITPAWTSFISYTFTGTKSAGGVVSKTMTLGSTTSPILYDDWVDFTDLASIYFSFNGSPYNDHIVFDDMEVEINSPCIDGSSVIDRPPPVTDGSNVAAGPY